MIFGEGCMPRRLSPIAGVGVLLVALLAGPSAAQQGELCRLYNPEGTIELLEKGLKNIKRYRTYTYVFVRQEKIGDKLQPEEHIAVKLRHRPFSVYMKWIDDVTLNKDRAGRELLYVHGTNEGKFVAHLGPVDNLIIPFRTVWLDPNDKLVRERSRHPVTKAGLRNVMESLHDQFLLARKNGDLTPENVTITEDKNLWFTRDSEGKQALPMAIKIVRRLPERPEYYCHEATIHLDPRTCFPLRVKTRYWNGAIMEIYTYKSVERASLTADDFNIDNKSYHFK